MNYDVGTQRAAFILFYAFVILTTEGRKDLGNIHKDYAMLPRSFTTRCSVQDDTAGCRDVACHVSFCGCILFLTQRRKDTESYYLRFIEFTEVSYSLSNTD